LKKYNVVFSPVRPEIHFIVIQTNDGLLLPFMQN